MIKIYYTYSIAKHCTRKNIKYSCLFQDWMTRGADVLDIVLASVKIRPRAEASGMVLITRGFNQNISGFANWVLRLYRGT